MTSHGLLLRALAVLGQAPLPASEGEGEAGGDGYINVPTLLRAAAQPTHARRPPGRGQLRPTVPVPALRCLQALEAKFSFCPQKPNGQKQQNGEDWKQIPTP